MKKILIIVFLLAGFVACEHQNQFDPQPTTAPKQATEVTDDVIGEIITKAAQRDLPIVGIKANASGPASMPTGTTSNESVVPTNAIDFQPNAGVIWKDLATGNTHLLALQLPGIPGSRQVKWASLGTGWGGATHMIINPNGFYVVWNNAIYKASKTKPDSWSLALPNNGEPIRAIESDPASGGNGYLVRGNSFYRYKTSFDNTFNLVAITPSPSISSIPYTQEMAYVSTGDFDWDLLIKTSLPSPNRLIKYFYNVNNNVLGWKKLLSYQVPGLSAGRMVGNQVTKLVYETRPNDPSRVFTINPIDGSSSLFSTEYFTPQSAPLVVNNGYIWIMGDTLQQLMTLGSAKGQAAYRESGWYGIQVACAAPFAVFN
jgi:hypothetical protein